MTGDRAGPVCRRSLVVVVLAVVIGIGLAAAFEVARSGGIVPWLARSGVAPPIGGQGRLVDIGGRSLYLDCRGTGSPTVILESGMGGGAGGWPLVHDALAATTRTCTYDRAGRGNSDPRGRHTLVDAAADLRSLLTAAGEPGPFIVAGHSLGGDYARVFADRYGPEVAGLVLVDAFTPDLETEFIHPLLGELRKEYEARLDALRAQVEAVEDLDWAASEAKLRAIVPAGLAMEVLSAPRGESRLDGPTNEAIAAARIAGYESLSPGRVRFELAWGAGHVIQDDRPDLVVEAVRRLVAAVRSR